MPFDFKNVGATYQRLMNVVFFHQIEKNLEVYVDDMIVKIVKYHSHAVDLEDVLQSVKKHNMRLNPANFSFKVQAGMFLGFILTKRSI